jgi:hypothetical protein
LREVYTLTRDEFRKKTLRGAKVIDLLEELEGLESKAKKGMETENKEELYYWHGILQFSMTVKRRVEQSFKIESV